MCFMREFLEKLRLADRKRRVDDEDVDDREEKGYERCERNAKRTHERERNRYENEENGENENEQERNEVVCEQCGERGSRHHPRTLQCRERTLGKYHRTKTRHREPDEQDDRKDSERDKCDKLDRRELDREPRRHLLGKIDEREGKRERYEQRRDRDEQQDRLDHHETQHTASIEREIEHRMIERAIRKAQRDERKIRNDGEHHDTRQRTDEQAETLGCRSNRTHEELNDKDDHREHDDLHRESAQAIKSRRERSTNEHTRAQEHGFKKSSTRTHPMELYLVRHGQSEGNVSRTNEGWMPAHLTEHGREQARLVAERFKNTHIDRIISSDLVRARETADAIAAHHPDTPLETDEGLREWNLGRHEGSAYGTIFKAMDESGTGRLDYPIEGGETIREFKKRVTDTIEKIRTYPDETILIVTHGGFILNALLHLLELPDERFGEFDPENTGVAHLTITDTVRVNMLNDIRHLTPQMRSGFSTFQERERESHR